MLNYYMMVYLPVCSPLAVGDISSILGHFKSKTVNKRYIKTKG